MLVQQYLAIIITYLLDLDVFKVYGFLYKDIKSFRGKVVQFFVTPGRYREWRLIYYADRRDFTCCMVRLWRLFRYKHILKVEDQILFFDLMTFLVDYWIMSAKYKSYRSFIHDKKRVTDVDICYMYRDYILFTKKEYLKRFSAMDHEFSVHEMGLSFRPKRKPIYKYKYKKGK